MKLEILNNKLKVVKLKVDEIVPEIIYKQKFYSIIKTDEELSIVINEMKKIQLGEYLMIKT